MNIVPLQAIPNQSLTIQLDNISYDMRFHVCGDIMCIDLSIDNVVVLVGSRLVAGYPVIPYAYLENGNFVFLTENDDYPFWDQFGITQYMIYASQQELEAIRGNSST